MKLQVHLLHAFLQMKPSTTDLALGKVTFEKKNIMQDTTQGIATKAHELSCYCLVFNEWIGLVETSKMEANTTVVQVLLSNAK